MQYGHFDDSRREYVITRPDTPLPWINYLGSQAYFGLISNTAGGYSFYRDARLRRLTRYRYNNVPFDTGGRYIYLRDDSNAGGLETSAGPSAATSKPPEGSGAGGHEAHPYWSPSWQPTRTPLEDYTCRHGLGYTVIASTYRGIRAETLYFVPLNHDLEIWRLTVTNQRAEPAQLSVFSAIEFCLWDAWDDATNFQRNFSTGEVEVEDGVIYHKTEYRERRNHFAYFACSEPLTGFDTQREAFLGPYRGWDAPAVVERGASAGSLANGWAPIGSHHVRLSLAPGESRTILFVLGYAENPSDAKFDPPDSQTINKRQLLPVLREFLDPAAVEAARAELAASWERVLGRFTVQTPDLHTNRMAGIWNAYQCMITFNMSRSASFYESGVGRGMGFRDSNQDLLGFVHMVPERARERILDLAATQLPSGGAYHQYQPLTKHGNDLVGSNFNDDPLWLVLATAAYLKETGDGAILDAAVPYDNQPGSATPLYEHLQRSIRYTLERLGPHGLPLIGRADWNDCLNLNCFSETPGESFQTTTNREGTVAESVFIAGLFVLAAQEMAQIADGRWRMADSVTQNAKRKTQEADYAQLAAQMEATIKEHGWDGAWFRRAYDALGQPVGAASCAEGQIFIEPQGICVMAGIGLADGRAAQALDSVAGRLATAHGIVLLQPAYSRYYLNLGEISTYPPGYKENASIFCHTNPWIMIGEAMLGRGDRAHDYYLRINPSNREAISDVHRCEPYVYAQMIAGRDAATHGEAKNSWLSGTAAWNYVAITQWILGIRPDYYGLRVAPVIPTHWPGFSATRLFRGVTYHIHVTRRGPGNAVSLTVDGRPVAGDLAPFPPAGQTDVAVQVVLDAN
ncbi:MAG: glycosyl transferase [Chloroflexi bacterium]|nr:glycosyl transferase [Chloroflexota bacterium]